MKAFNRYSIEFIFGNDPEPHVQSFKAASMAHAFAICRKKNPRAKLLRGFLEGERFGQRWSTTYDAPSTAGVEVLPAPKTEELTFPFWDQCLSRRPR